MVSKEGIEEQKGLLIFSNFQFIISIEGVVQIEENLKASPESLLGHIEIGFKDVPVVTEVCWKGRVIVFFHDGCEVPVLPGAFNFFAIVVHHTSLSLVCLQEDASMEDKLFVEMLHFCVQTYC